MTTEEAIERVLEGPEWLKCPHCKLGMVSSEPDARGESIRRRCERCRGMNAVPTPETDEAYRIVGATLPLPTKRQVVDGVSVWTGPEYARMPFEVDEDLGFYESAHDA